MTEYSVFIDSSERNGCCTQRYLLGMFGKFEKIHSTEMDVLPHKYDILLTVVLYK